MSNTESPILQSHLVSLERLTTITTLIGPRTSMRGNLVADDASDDPVGIKVDGNLDGSITIPSGGVIWVGPTGEVKGETLEADYIYIAGNVKGKVIGRRGVELTGTCTVDGEIEYHGSLNTHNLAKVRASIRYVGDN